MPFIVETDLTMLDTSGNGFVTALDVLLVVNELNGQGEEEGEGEQGSFDLGDEPALRSTDAVFGGQLWEEFDAWEEDLEKRRRPVK